MSNVLAQFSANTATSRSVTVATSKVIIGIDPGLSGAVAVLAYGVAAVWDTPTVTVKKREYNIPEMAGIIRAHWGSAHVFIEAVHSMPKQGVSSSFTFGKGYGIWLGIVAALGLPYDLVTPQRWKGQMLAGMPKGKGSSRIRATQLFPALSDKLSRVKDDGRAEALLLAEFGRRLLSVTTDVEGSTR